MKKRLLILGIIAAIILVTLVFASNLEQLTAYVANFRIIVDGEERIFENPIVVIDNRTYIPLREVSEVLGMNVEWCDENQEIIINSRPELYNEWGIVLYRFIDENGLRGFKDALGNVIIEPQFMFARDFSEGLAFVSKEIDCGEFRGYIDLSGNLVIPLPTVWVGQISSTAFGANALDFSEGFAWVVVREWDWDNELVQSTGLPGPTIFIDRTGENIFGMEFSGAGDFQNGYAPVTLLDWVTRTYIDRNGNIVDSQSN